MEQEWVSERTAKADPARLKAEWPAEGTALNPVETDWVFNQTAGAVPPDELAGSFQQGE